jgi:hypothetical protein
MLQQWARRYIKNSQRQRLSPEERARTHAFFAKAVKELRISQMVEVLPALLHVSIFLFFSGLSTFLRDINSSFQLVNFWITISFIMYGFITALPFFWPGSPYFTPLTTPYVVISQILAFPLLYAFRHMLNLPHVGWLANIVRRSEQQAISKLSPSLDRNILNRMVYAIGEDDTLEKFFDVIPGFFNSELVKGFRRHFPPAVSENFQETLREFLRCTLSTNTVPELVKTRRLDICINAMNVIHSSEAGSEIFNDILYGRLGPIPQSVETGHALARWCRSNQREIAVPARCVVARILANVRERDELWVALANDQFDLPEHLVRDNITHGDNSVLLSILIHVARQAIRSGSLTPGVLYSLSQFSIHDTAPGLQQDFCTLWNEVVQAPRTNSISADILDEIRDLYIALHQGTEVVPTQFPAPIGNDDNLLWWPWSYPLCTIASHRPGTTDRELSPSPAVLPPQSGDSLDALPHSTFLESQAAPSSSIPPLQAAEASTTSPIRAAPRVSWVTDHSTPENIGTVEVHEDTRDQDPLAPLEDPRHPHRSALSPAETVASVVPSDNPSPPIRTEEAGEASQAPAATSLNFPRTGPDISAFSVPEPIHTSPRRMDGSSQASPSDLASDL